MKRSIVTLLTALALTCALCLPAGAETLAELRQETAGGWHETLTDQNGTPVRVDADIDIRPGAEEVSALRVSAGAFHQEVESAEGQIADILRRNNQSPKTRAVQAALEKAKKTDP